MAEMYEGIGLYIILREGAMARKERSGAAALVRHDWRKDGNCRAGFQITVVPRAVGYIVTPAGRALDTRLRFWGSQASSYGTKKLFLKQRGVQARGVTHGSKRWSHNFFPPGNYPITT
jgi:hypothetical protein